MMPVGTVYWPTTGLHWLTRLALRFVRPRVETLDGHVIWYKPLFGKKYVYGFYPYQQHEMYPQRRKK